MAVDEATHVLGQDFLTGHWVAIDPAG
jgi:hypothetical protein